MGLILSLREGEHVRIGETRFDVIQILNGRRGMVLQDPEGTAFEINDDRAAEVLPGVWVSAGDRARHSQCARVVIEAPISIPIERGRDEAGPQKDRGPDPGGSEPG